MAHIHEKIDFTSSAYIVHDGKVLLHMHDKYNIWLGMGGHIELDEDPIEALYREVKEECGLEIEVIAGVTKRFADGSLSLPAPDFLIRVKVDGVHEHVDLGYAARAKTLNIHRAEGEAEVEFKWFSPEDLDNPEFKVKDHVRHHALSALKLATLNL